MIWSHQIIPPAANKHIQSLQLAILNVFAEDTKALSPPNLSVLAGVCKKHVLLDHGWSPGGWWIRSKNPPEQIL